MMRKAMLILTLVALTAVAVAPTATAGPPEPSCMPVYREYDLGPVRVVSPDSCTVHVYVFGEPLLS
ncbi:MAG: hypothetical protein ACPHID_02230 [Thermoplasmatota archaeon]